MRPYWLRKINRGGHARPPNLPLRLRCRSFGRCESAVLLMLVLCSDRARFWGGAVCDGGAPNSPGKRLNGGRSKRRSIAHTRSSRAAAADCRTTPSRSEFGSSFKSCCWHVKRKRRRGRRGLRLAVRCLSTRLSDLNWSVAMKCGMRGLLINGRKNGSIFGHRRKILVWLDGDSMDYLCSFGYLVNVVYNLAIPCLDKSSDMFNNGAIKVQSVSHNV